MTGQQERRRRTDFGDFDAVANDLSLTDYDFAGLDNKAPDRSSRFISRLFDYAVRLRKHFVEVLVEHRKLREAFNQATVRLAEQKAEIEHLTKAAYIDELTKLPNRAAFKHALEYAKSGGHHLAIAFIDLDGFKQINDTHGHDIGDEALRNIAAHLQGHIRSNHTIYLPSRAVDIDLSENRPDDIVCRLGGDEFVIIFKDTNAEQMKERINKIGEGLAKKIPFSDGQNTHHIGGSMGVVDCPPDMPVEAALRLADKKMYDMKEGRRALKRAQVAAEQCAPWYDAEMRELQVQIASRPKPS